MSGLFAKLHFFRSRLAWKRNYILNKVRWQQPKTVIISKDLGAKLTARMPLSWYMFVRGRSATPTSDTILRYDVWYSKRYPRSRWTVNKVTRIARRLE